MNLGECRSYQPTVMVKDICAINSKLMAAPNIPDVASASSVSPDQAYKASDTMVELPNSGENLIQDGHLGATTNGLDKTCCDQTKRGGLTDDLHSCQHGKGKQNLVEENIFDKLSDHRRNDLSFASIETCSGELKDPDCHTSSHKLAVNKRKRLIGNSVDSNSEYLKVMDKSSSFSFMVPTGQDYSQGETSTKRNRMSSYPQLNEMVYDIIIRFLKQEEKLKIQHGCSYSQTVHFDWPLLVAQLRSAELPVARGVSVQKAFLGWIAEIKLSTRSSGKSVLLLKESGKQILPSSHYSRVIRDAHRSAGLFKSYAKMSDDGKVLHNSAAVTIDLVKRFYTFGDLEFGMRKLDVYQEIMLCPFCDDLAKQVPMEELCLLEDQEKRVCAAKDEAKVTLAESVAQTSDAVQEHVSLDLDCVLDLRDAPISMVLDVPTADSIWYNQQGLADQTNLFQKFLGVISEMSADLGLAVQCDEMARDRLTTKIYCADRLLSELTKRAAQSDSDKLEGDFMEQYHALEKLYLQIGRLDLFLYDINLLIIKYDLVKNKDFMATVNKFVGNFMQRWRPTSGFLSPLPIAEKDS